MNLSKVHTYRLKIAYDGTDFSGWQYQPNAPTIQEEIEKALQILLKEKVVIVGAGRTDAGVHAYEQIAHFKTEKTLDAFTFLASLNGILPKTIRIHACDAVADDFHARYSAQGKIYHYFIQPKRFTNPLRRLYSHHPRHPIDVEAMQRAARHFVGKHDFSSFANEAHQGSAAKNPVRTLRRLDLVEEADGVLRLEFEGDGFLYKMVRNITGTLLEVAAGKRDPDSIPELLAAKNRRLAGKAAPALGLAMVKVFYQ